MNELPPEDSQNIDKPIPNLPVPQPFHITEPHQERGLWCFWLTADDDVLRFVYNLNCTMIPGFSRSPFGRRKVGRVLFAFNPRYEHEETWNWLHEVLESETKQVELSDDWEAAIRDARISSGGVE